MLYEKLSNSDIDTFVSYVQTYGPSNDAEIYGSIADPAHILRVWDEAKSEYLYKAFGERFIIEQEIEWSQPRREIYNAIASSLEYGELSYFRSEFKAAIFKEFDLDDDYYFLLRLFDRDCLVDNMTRNLPNKTIEFKNGQSIKLVNGAKTIKLLGKIAKCLNLETSFEQFRLKHSLLLNKKKVKGTLCLSIHPMDYLTMSDNENGWTSCMSWSEDGDYRMGTVEMMNSPNTIVAYLKSSDKKLHWNNYSWNSKLWRTLIVVDPAVIVSVKNYPYEHVEGTKFCIEELRKLVIENLGWDFPYPCEELKEDTTFNFNGEPKRFTCETYKMYNDFGSMPSYGIISDKLTARTYITYSGPTECMLCGTTNEHFYEDANFVYCSNCSSNYNESYYNCDECGDRYYEDDIYWVEDTPICWHCFGNYAIECAITGNYYFKYNSCQVYLASLKDNPDSDKDDCIEAGFEYVTNEHNYRTDSWLACYIKCAPHFDKEKRIYYWNIEDLTHIGLWHYYGLKDESLERYIRFPDSGNLDNTED